MKIAPKAADAFLARPDGEYRAVLLYGPDGGLVRERARLIADKALSGSKDPFALVELSEAGLLADAARLADELSAVSMMVPKRVILIRDAGDKLTRIIEGASSCFDPSVFLIVCGDELPSRSSLRGWFEKDARCAALACYKDEMRDVQALVRRSFEAAGLPADREIVDYLAAQLGNDRGVTQQELEKIITFAGEEKKLTLDEVRALVDYNRDTGNDDLTAAVADRDLARLEKTLTLLLREGTQPVAYLRALQRYFNRLYYLRSQIDGGQSAEQAVAALRPPVFFRQAPVLARHAQNWTLPQLVKALRLLVLAELACKTSDVPVIPASSRRLLQVTQAR